MCSFIYLCVYCVLICVLPCIWQTKLFINARDDADKEREWKDNEMRSWNKNWSTDKGFEFRMELWQRYGKYRISLSDEWLILALATWRSCVSRVLQVQEHDEWKTCMYTAPVIHHYFMIDLWRVTSCVLLLLYANLRRERMNEVPVLTPLAHMKWNWNKTETKQFNFSLISAARTREIKLKQNTETTLKLFRSCFRLISIFTDMSKNVQIVKLSQAIKNLKRNSSARSTKWRHMSWVPQFRSL